jgi:hypothetical protein
MMGWMKIWSKKKLIKLLKSFGGESENNEKFYVSSVCIWRIK